MSKTRRKTKAAPQDSVVGYVYLTIVIVLCLIALMHEMTGFLGRWLFVIGRFLFGEAWFVPYVLIALWCLVKAFRQKISGKIWTTVILFFMAAILILGCVSFKDNTQSGTELIKDFFSKAKEMFVNGPIGKGGMFAVLGYGLISALANFWGVIIVICVLFAVGVLIHTESIAKWLRGLKKPQLAKKKPEPKKERQFNLFDQDEIKERKKEKELEKQREKELKLLEKEQQMAEKTEKKPEAKPFIEEKKPAVSAGTDGSSNSFANYKPPYLSYLDNPSVSKNTVNRRNASEKWQILSDILESFDLKSRLEGYNIGPSITQFEIVPEGNFNINKYSSIESNIKMALAVKDVRIEAPIPGKRAVGIEIPNEEPSIVRLKELLKDVPDEYQHEPLMFALGKDITGKNRYGLINKMPHMLVAGATNSGKSVCINSIIISLLLRARPDEVRLLLIDPKKVEFSSYANIPHLICPIVTETEKAPAILGKLIKIMMDRYELFSQKGVRKIEEYNETYPDEKLYSIVCIIDELYDLMVRHGKEVETYINRLASLARAAGIHLILATQRPSTDVITGTIKANISTRIAFSTISGYDSKTILDGPGAEKLLGNGDMLYKPSDANRPTRIQGVYVSKDEIDRITDYFVKSNFTPKFEDIFMHDEDEEEGEDGEMVPSGVKDRQYPEVERWVRTQKTISANQIQRRFNMGYPHAANLIDALEYNGIISPSKGSKPRDVLVSDDQQ
ncbi:MAG: DNA translocase FtsK [Erysipelotrichaceae bacterium]|nr:DNA translocase FtsK [Erysipelotrichaceae bacterium]